MTRATYRLCKCCEGFHDIHKPWPHNCLSHFGEPAKRSELSAPYFVTDTTQAFRGQHDGQMYDSKSAYRRSLKNGETKYMELGNDAPAQPVGPGRERVTKAEIAAAVDMVKQGYKPSISHERTDISTSGAAWVD